MKKEYLLILIFLLPILAIIVYYLFFSPISVVKASLEQNVKDVSLEPEIAFRFDRSAESVLGNIKVSSDPEAKWGIEIVDSITIKVKSKEELLPLTLYKLTIFGPRVNIYVLTFTTKNIKFGIGSSDAEKAFDDYAKAFPLLKFLPYRADRYTIMQRERDHYFVIIPEIYQAAIDMEKVKAEVFAWFKSHGVEPDSVKIDF